MTDESKPSKGSVMEALPGATVMTDPKAAVIIAITDKIAHGDSAKPSGYWGVANGASQELDAKLKALTKEDMEAVLTKLVTEKP